MDSEKIKEIKKALECCSMLMDNTKTAEEQDNACNECPYRLNDRCSWCLDKDALELINELESENTKLKKCRNENKRLRTRVGNLKAFIMKQKMEYELLKCGKKIGNGIIEIANKTKSELLLYSFAERLKERLRYTSPTSDVLELRNLEFDGIEVEQCIDETLKEMFDEQQ